MWPTSIRNEELLIHKPRPTREVLCNAFDQHSLYMHAMCYMKLSWGLAHSVAPQKKLAKPIYSLWGHHLYSPMRKNQLPWFISSVTAGWLCRSHFRYQSTLAFHHSNCLDCDATGTFQATKESPWATLLSDSWFLIWTISVQLMWTPSVFCFWAVALSLVTAWGGWGLDLKAC